MADNFGGCHSQNKSKEVSSVARPALAISSSQRPVSGHKNAKMEEAQKKEVREDNSAGARFSLYKRQVLTRESPLEDYGIYDSVKSQLARGKGPKTQVSSTTRVTNPGASRGSSTTQVTHGGSPSSHAASGS